MHNSAENLLIHDTDVAASLAAVEIASQFVQARLAARALPAYPGIQPSNRNQAYAIQDTAIALMPDQVAGWKVGAIPEAWLARVGEARLVGPVFQRNLRSIAAHVNATDHVAVLKIISGGFAAVEAEYVFKLGLDAAPERSDWQPDEAALLVSSLHMGIEHAGSPLATINALGPLVVMSDFGNNAGVLLGPEIADWQKIPPAELQCDTWINGLCVGKGGAASLPGGPLSALTFALNCCAARGRPLRAGMIVSTGATTGIHAIAHGEYAEVRFSEGTVLKCHAVAANLEAK